MYKIYKDNNYITVEDVLKKEHYYGHAKDVFVDKSNVGISQYTIKSIKNFSELKVLNIGKILKQNGDVYTQSEWETFYKENTGFSTASGGSDAVTEIGVELDLSNNTTGKYYNMPSANSGETYTFINEVDGGWAKSLINTTSEPTVTGATKIAGADWVMDTNMYMVVNYNGDRVEYFFLEI